VRSAAATLLNGRTFSSVRKHRNYRLYFYGQLVSLSGTWMQDTALPWLVLVLTHSPVDVGVLVFCRYVPFLFFGLYAGLIADRHDNRRLLIATQVASMTIAAALAAATLTHWTPLWLVFLLATLGGTSLVFESPNRHALVYQLVGREELPNAVALNSSIFNGARAVGPALGGGLIALVGAGWCFAFNSASFLAILVGLLLMQTRELFPVERASRAEPALVAIRDGLAYARRSLPVRIVLGMTLVISVAGFNFRVLVPVLAEKTLVAGAAVFGVLFACFGIGALVGALLTASLGRASWRALVAGSVLFNGAVLALAPLRSVAAAAILLLVCGLGFSLWTSNSQSVLQLTTPDRLRGRVLSLYLLSFAGLQPLGGLLAGWLADIGGTELAFLVAGAAGLASTAAALDSVRGVRLPRQRPVAIAADDGGD